MKHFWFAVLPVLLVFSHCGNSSHPVIPEAKKGVLDLRDSGIWNRESGKNSELVSLDGEWEFYWHKLLSPDAEGEFSQSGLKKEYIPVPSQWQQHGHPAYGYATYRLKVLLPSERPKLSFAMRDASMAYEMYANGTLILSDGRVGKSREEMVPFLKYKFFDWESDSEELEIIIRVSNFHHYEAGLWNTIQIGPRSSVESLRIRNVAIESILFASLAIMGLYHLGLYFYRRKDRSPLYFGIFCILVAIRTISISERSIMDAIPFLPFVFVHKLEYLSFYYGVFVFAKYIRSRFPNDFSMFMYRILAFVYIPASLLVIVTPLHIYTRSLFIGQIGAVVAILYTLVVIAQSIFRARDGAKPLLFGLVFFFGTVIFDILKDVGIVHSPYPMASYGLLSFVLFQSIDLSRNFSTGFTESERLSEELTILSEGLEEKVEERTNEINLLLKEAEKAKEETEILADLARRANEADGIDKILSVVDKITRNRFEATSLGLYSVDRGSNEFRILSYFVEGEKRNPEELPLILQTAPISKESGTIYHALRKGSTFHVSRIDPKWIQEYPMDNAFVEMFHHKWFVQQPLKVNGEVIAIMTFSGNESRRLSREELRFCDRMAEQVAGAVRSSNLLQEAEEARSQAEKAKAETEIMADLARRANEASGLDEILSAVGMVTLDRFGANNLALYLTDNKVHHLRLLSYLVQGNKKDTEDLPEILKNIPLSAASGTLYRTLVRGKIFHVPEINEKWLEGSPVDKAFVINSRSKWIAHEPLKIHGQIIGILGLGGPNPRRLNREELRFCDRMAEQVAGAVRTSNLLRETEEARSASEKAKRETEILAELAKRANEANDIDEILGSVGNVTRDLFGAGTLALYLINRERNEFRLLSNFVQGEKAELQNIPEILQKIPIAEKSGTLYRTFQKGKTFHIPEINSDWLERSPVDLAFVEHGSSRFTVQQPLKVNGETIGMLVFSGPEKRKLSREEIRFCDRMAEQVAGAVRTSNLLQETEQSRNTAERAKEETEILADLARRANEATDIDEILRSLGDVTQIQFGANNLGLHLLDRDKNELRVLSNFVQGKKIANEALADGLKRIPISSESGSFYHTIKKGKTLHVSKVDPKWLETYPIDKEFIEISNAKWFVQQPLRVNGEIVAMLTLSGTEERKLNKEEIRFFDRIGQQVAGAVRTRELLQRVQEEQERSESLLKNILPDSVAQELKNNGQVEPKLFESVSVLFTDFVGFTKASEKMSPSELVRELDGSFSQFDEVIRRNNMEKLKTIGDSMMCAGGLPEKNESHAIDACLTALEFRSFMLQMAAVKSSMDHDFWQIRIGIHSGPVTAGVIGTTKFAYDIWGDTVNTASRMESSGKPGQINISGSTYELVKEYFECEYRGKVQAKGKGEIDMYFLERIKPEYSYDEEGLAPNERFKSLQNNASVTSQY